MAETSQPEQDRTAAEVAASVRDADPLTTARIAEAEQQREDGPRVTVLHAVERAKTRAERETAAAGVPTYTQADLTAQASAFDTTSWEIEALFRSLGPARERLTEEEFREALQAFRTMEVK